MMVDNQSRGLPPKRDWTIPAVIGAIVLVIILANVVTLPGCGSTRQVANLEGLPTVARPVAKPAAIWYRYNLALSKDGSVWVAPALARARIEYRRSGVDADQEVRLGTDGTTLFGYFWVCDPQVFANPPAKSAAPVDAGSAASATSPDAEPATGLDASVAADSPWHGEGFDIRIRAAGEGTTTYRIGVAHDGHLSLSRGAGLGFAPGDAGETQALPESATSSATKVAGGSEITFAIPLDALGLAGLKIGDACQMQVFHHVGAPAEGGKVRILLDPGPVDKPLRLTDTETLMQAVKIIAPDTKAKPHRTGVAKTETPVISLVADLATVQPVPFPPLRTHEGDDWTGETTTVTMASDGVILRVHADCSDRSPRKLVDGNAIDQKSFMPFRDDSMEFFFSPSVRDPFYYQIVVSNTGAFATYRYVNAPGNDLIYRPWHPASIQVVVAQKDGYTIDIDLALADFGMTGLKPGDAPRIQVARNYRGQGNPNSVILQLFPLAIYGDKKSSLNNHDRAGHQPVKIVAQ